MRPEIKDILADMLDNYPVDDVVCEVAAMLSLVAANADSDFSIDVKSSYGDYTVRVEKVDAEPNT